MIANVQLKQNGNRQQVRLIQIAYFIILSVTLMHISASNTKMMHVTLAERRNMESIKNDYGITRLATMQGYSHVLSRIRRWIS